MSHKMAVTCPFVLKPRSLGEPRLDGGRAVLSFPFRQSLVIAAFGFDDFAGVRVFVDLHLAWLTGACFRLDGWSATASLRVKQVDHFRQAVTVLCKQSTQLRFEFNFLFEA